MPAFDILPLKQTGQEFALGWHPGAGQLDFLLAEDPGRRKNYVRCVASPKRVRKQTNWVLLLKVTVASRMPSRWHKGVKYSRRLYALVNKARQGINDQEHRHVHPAPPGESVGAVQSGVDCGHEKPREKRADRGEDLDQRVASCQLVGLVVARAHVHDCREVAGLEQANAAGRSQRPDGWKRKATSPGRETNKKRKT